MHDQTAAATYSDPPGIKDYYTHAMSPPGEQNSQADDFRALIKFVGLC